MSVASCIQGLQTMTLGAGGASQMDSGTVVTTLDDGYCITERYTDLRYEAAGEGYAADERYAAAGAIQRVGGLDGLRVTMNFLFMNLDVYLPPIPLDLLEILTRGLVERVCDGRLDEARAAELALGRAAFLLTHDVYLPLTPAIAPAVYEAIHEQEKSVYFGE